MLLCNKCFLRTNHVPEFGLGSGNVLTYSEEGIVNDGLLCNQRQGELHLPPVPAPVGLRRSMIWNYLGKELKTFTGINLLELQRSIFFLCSVSLHMLFSLHPQPPTLHRSYPSSWAKLRVTCSFWTTVQVGCLSSGTPILPLCFLPSSLAPTNHSQCPPRL